MRFSQEPDTLNPFLSGMSVAQDAMRPVLLGLLGVDDRMALFPALASTVPTPENGLVRIVAGDLVVTYPLRKGILWHDGLPFTAKDVAFTWRYAINPAARVIDRSGYDRIRTVDAAIADRARVVFKGLYAPYLKLFGTILPEHLLAGEKAPNTAAFNSRPIGTGPYKVTAWASGDRIELEAAPTYHGKAPAVRRLILQVIPDDNTAFVRFKSGDLDVYQTVALSQLEEVADLPGTTITTTPDTLYEHIALNTARSPFDDVRVRRAVSLGVDKAAIAREAYGGVYVPAWSDQPPLSWAFDPSLIGRFDLAEAAKLLTAAGWLPGKDAVRRKAAKRLEVVLLTTSGKKPRELAALLIRHDLERLGFDVQVRTLPGSLFFSPTGPLKLGEFDLGMWAWNTDLDPDSTNFWRSDRIPPNGSNVTRFKDVRLDTLLDQAASTVDRGERVRLYLAVSRLLAKEVPDIPLLYWNVVNARKANLQGWRPGPIGNLWNCQDWIWKF